jgi:hypothetical protein
MTRHVLLVTTSPDPADELLEFLEHEGGSDVEVAVVAPAADESPLEWFADDDRRAREEAWRRAMESAEVEALGAHVVRVEVGDPDPIAAIKDALETFPADQLVVVTRPRQAATWLEKRLLDGELERLGLPVTHLVDDDVPSEAAREVELPPTFRFVVRAVLLVSAVLIVVGLWLYFSLR